MTKKHTLDMLMDPLEAPKPPDIPGQEELFLCMGSPPLPMPE